MEVRHPVQRYPRAAFLLILGLAAALATVMTLSVGGWGLSIGSPTTLSGPAAQSQPEIKLQQPPDAQDRNQHYGLQPVATPQACAGSLSECSS